MRSTVRPKADRRLGLLNGTWLVMDGHIGGVRLPDNAFDELTLTLENGRFELGVDLGRVVVDREAAPAALDLVIVAGPNRGRYVPAIVERVGQLLRICFDLAGMRGRRHSGRRPVPVTSSPRTGAPPPAIGVFPARSPEPFVPARRSVQ